MCSFFQMRELSKEAAYGQHQVKKQSTSNQKGKRAPPRLAAPPQASLKLKVFNLVTFKLCALGDYVRTIRWFGTSDSYSMQPVHCLKF